MTVAWRRWPKYLRNLLKQMFGFGLSLPFRLNLNSLLSFSSASWKFYSRKQQLNKCNSKVPFSNGEHNRIYLRNEFEFTIATIKRRIVVRVFFHLREFHARAKAEGKRKYRKVLSIIIVVVFRAFFSFWNFFGFYIARDLMGQSVFFVVVGLLKDENFKADDWTQRRCLESCDCKE